MSRTNRVGHVRSSPDFTREEFLAHAQVRVIEAMNAYENDTQTTGNLGVNNKLFTHALVQKWTTFILKLML